MQTLIPSHLWKDKRFKRCSHQAKLMLLFLMRFADESGKLTLNGELSEELYPALKLSDESAADLMMELVKVGIIKCIDDVLYLHDIQIAKALSSEDYVVPDAYFMLN